MLIPLYGTASFVTRYDSRNDWNGNSSPEMTQKTVAEPEPLAVHTEKGLADAIERLWRALDAHFHHQGHVPERTVRLTAAGDKKMAQKLVEEAGETALAAVMGDRDELVAESADLLYHLTLLWASLGVRPYDVAAEMAAREATYGLAEKRAKAARKDSMRD